MSAKSGKPSNVVLRLIAVCRAALMERGSDAIREVVFDERSLNPVISSPRLVNKPALSLAFWSVPPT